MNPEIFDSLGFSYIQDQPTNQPIKKAKPSRLQETAERFGFSDPFEMLEEYAFESIVPSVCPHGCEVEPDGKCSHGFKSFMLVMGVI
jgi:hypothetical protein